MKINFLGTNGWYDSDTGNTICTLIESKDFYLILDAGNGLNKIDRYITTEKPIYLFLSHLHIDHIEGLHILNKFNFFQGLNIYGHTGIVNSLNKFVNRPFTMPLNDLKYKVRVHEFEEGDHKKPLPFSTLKLFHSGDAYGYRFYIEDKVVVYNTDTGMCENDFILSKDADILIHECTFKKQIPGGKWGHSTPVEAAQLAKKVKVKQLILDHFEAARYTKIEDRQEAENNAKKIFPNTIAAKDGLIINC